MFRIEDELKKCDMNKFRRNCTNLKVVALRSGFKAKVNSERNLFELLVNDLKQVNERELKRYELELILNEWKQVSKY